MEATPDYYYANHKLIKAVEATNEEVIHGLPLYTQSTIERLLTAQMEYTADECTKIIEKTFKDMTHAQG